MSHFIFYLGTVNEKGARNLQSVLSDAVISGKSNITLCLCSPGGDVVSGVGIYNFIRMLPVPVRTYAYGFCGSIAATIFMAGNDRFSTKNSAFMLHAATYSEGQNAGKVSDKNHLIWKPFESRLGWTPDQIARYFGSATETLVTPEDALALRIVDAVKDIAMVEQDTAVHVAVP